MAGKHRRIGPAELAIRHQVQADNICGSLTKIGDVCMRGAGWGTDHPRVGPCKDHDHYRQITTRVPGSRYSAGLAGSALEFFLEMANDPEVKRLDDEIALLRMSLNDTNLMIQDIRDRAAVPLESTDAFGNINQIKRMGDHLPAAGSIKVDPWGDADRKALLQLNRDRARIAESVAKLISQKHRIEEGKIVTYRQVQEVLAQVVYVVTKHVTDESMRAAIAEDFARIDVSNFEL